MFSFSRKWRLIIIIVYMKEFRPRLFGKLYEASMGPIIYIFYGRFLSRYRQSFAIYKREHFIVGISLLRYCYSRLNEKSISRNRNLLF